MHNKHVNWTTRGSMDTLKYTWLQVHMSRSITTGYILYTVLQQATQGYMRLHKTAQGQGYMRLNRFTCGYTGLQWIMYTRLKFNDATWGYMRLHKVT